MSQSTSTSPGRRPLSGFLVLWVAGLLLTSSPAVARSNNGGGWIMFYGSGSLEQASPRFDRVLWWFDGQLRMRDDSDGYDQTLIRPGLGFDLGKGWSVWQGYLYVNEDPDGSDNFDEHRSWQQLLWKGPLGGFGVQSRTRLEQRWVDDDGEAGWRFRQFVKATHGLGAGDRFGLASYDEVFFDLNDTSAGQDTGFTQNRFFFGPYLQVGSSRRLIVELGYLNQFIRRDGGSDSINHLVNLNLLFAFD